MRLRNTTEYFAATEYMQRLQRSLELGRSYMTGDDWEFFSKAIERQIQELSDAVREYKVNWDLHVLAQKFYKIELCVEGVFAIPAEASVTWGSPVPTPQSYGRPNATLTSACVGATAAAA
jgi:hypothetical protein